MPEQKRQLAAIMFTDIVGYTALMGEDEEKAYALLKKNRQVQKPLIEKHDGKWLKEIGDGVLASFKTVSDAAYCAIEIQLACKEELDLKLRIGIHLGEVIVEEEDVFGDGVNIASRLEPLAPVGGIYISESVYRNIENKKGIKAEFIREETLKNVKHPVRIYKVDVKGSEISYRQLDTEIIPESKNAIQYWKKPMLSFLAIILLVAATYLVYLQIGKSESERKKTGIEEREKSIAVLPFVNASSDDENEYFVAGMCEDIRNNLEKIGDLRVISKTSSDRYKNTQLLTKEIARELNVNYLLEGTIQRQGNQFKIHAQLIEPNTDDHLWSETYIREFNNYFEIQLEIARSIAGELKAVITPKEASIISDFPTTKIEAYDLFLKALFLFERGTPEDVSNAENLLEEAVLIDPEFTLAYAWLGHFKSQFWWFGESQLRSSEEAFKAGYPYIEKALDLDPNCIVALQNKASLLTLFKWEFEEAHRIEQYLTDTDPYYFSISFFILKGMHEEAESRAKKSFEVDPLSNTTWHRMIWSYYFNGKPEKALQAIEKVVETGLINIHLYIHITRIYLYLEHYQDALSIIEKFFEKNNNLRDSPWPLALKAIALYQLNMRDNIPEIIDILKIRQERSSIGSPSFFLAMVYAQMYQIETAFEWLEKSYLDRDVEMYWLPVEPLFEPLHSDPRWQEMLDKVGFPD